MDEERPIYISKWFNVLFFLRLNIEFIFLTFFYSAEFQPQSKKEIAHHILLFGCENVVDHDVW